MPDSFGIGSYERPTVLRWDREVKVHIGNYCSIAFEVTIFAGGNHRADWVTTFPFPARFPVPGAADHNDYHRGDVIIGSDVWIGYGATIMMGVTVGHGTVIAARSVVTKDVPPYSIIAGNPARVVRMRFTPDRIAALLKIAWWEWPLERVHEFAPLLCQPDIDAFIKAVESL